MDYYTEIQVLPNIEMPGYYLLQELYGRLHRAFVQCGNENIGISFPAFGKTLGDKIRLHGMKEELQLLMDRGFFNGLVDHLSIKGPLPVPEGALFRIVRRVRAKNSAARLRRRSVRKGWLSAEEASERIPLRQVATLTQPFLRIKSSSTGQMFRLFIEHGPLTSTPIQGPFSAYGLSDVATIPWF